LTTLFSLLPLESSKSNKLFIMKAWRQIQTILEKMVNPGQFKVWISPLKAELKGEQLVLKAPNTFVGTWVRERVLDSILQAATAVLGFAPEIRIDVAPAQPAKEKSSAIVRRDSRLNQLGLPIVPPVGDEHRRNWRFSFEDFVVGPSNELAYAAVNSLWRDTFQAERLFISSSSGLGKTHLLQALGRRICDQCNTRNPRIIYLTGEEFATRMILALKGKTIQEFKNLFRNNVDLLLLEDVHFFQGKQRIQDELLATLKALHERGSRVVLTSSLLPRELRDLDEGLASRFCSGFLAVISRPDYQTRRNILEHKAKNFFKLDLPEDVSDLLAGHLSTDVRQLESCLQNLIFEARLLKRKINGELAREVLAHYATECPSYDMDRIIGFVCRSFDLTLSELQSKSRKQQVVIARNTAFYLARQNTELSFKEIGECFNRKHSTVIKGVSNVEKELSMQTPLGRQLSKTMQLLSKFQSLNGSGGAKAPES